MSMSIQAQNPNFVPTVREIIDNFEAKEQDKGSESTNIHTVAINVDALRPADNEENSTTPPSISWKERCVAEYKLMAKDALMFAPQHFALGTAVVVAYVIMRETLKTLCIDLNEYNATEQAQLPFLEKMPVEYSMVFGLDTGFSLLAGAAVGSAVAAVGASVGLLQRHVISRLF